MYSPSIIGVSKPTQGPLLSLTCLKIIYDGIGERGGTSGNAQTTSSYSSGQG